MNVKKKARRVMSGLLTAVTVLSTVLSPAVAYASDDAGSVKKIPYYEEIKDQLDEDEVVIAKDYEIKVGDNFDVKSDYTGLTIQDDSKVKVIFQEAKDTDGNDFSTDYANSYKAVYYVEPQTTDHPTYQINRKIVVKEADQQKDSQSESSSDQDAGSSDKTETEDSEADSSTEETDAADTESKTELTEKEFDAEIEATEDQETVDPETGITLSEVMQEAVDQEVALADLEAGESITFDMPMMLASGETGTKSVTVTAGSWYYYADYGLGSYLTCPYYVKWGSINATAYCVEPSKKGPGNGTYTIQKLADGKTLAKICYYGTKASDENGFFDEKHPDFPDNKELAAITSKIYENGGVVAAVCHGPAALINVKLSNGKFLVDGKKINSFTNSEEKGIGLDKVVPFALETALVKRGAKFQSSDNFQSHVVVNDRVITGQNPMSATAVGDAIRIALQN